MGQEIQESHVKRRVALRRAAREDLIESYLFISLDSPDAAERFLQAAEESCNALGDMPEIGHRWESEDERLQDVRVWHVKGFANWLISTTSPRTTLTYCP